jgi:Family of unknown function (DUF6282)
MSDREAAGGLVAGAIDLYVHGKPDLLPRRTDDLGLARESAAAGLAAALHRHHYAPTAERSRLAADATGFPLLGAILLNDAVGGLNPAAVLLALEMGAVWVGLPTLSARAFRASGGGRAARAFDAALGFGPGDLVVLDDDGSVTPEARDVVGLVADAGVALNLGYVSTAEQLAMARLTAELGHERIVVTNASFDEEELAQALAIPGFTFEITSYGIHPEGLARDAERSAAGVARNCALIRRLGVDRVVLSSDGGMAGSPPPAEILAWALGQYADAGFTLEELRTLTHTNPRALVGEPVRPDLADV